MRCLKIQVGLIVILFVLTGLVNTACEPPNAEPGYRHALSKENEDERYALRQDLIRLRNSIDRKLTFVDEKLENASAETEDDLIVADRKLKSNRSKIDKAIYDLNNATDQTWGRVRDGAHTTSRDVKASFTELAHTIDNVTEQE